MTSLTKVTSPSQTALAVPNLTTAESRLSAPSKILATQTNIVSNILSFLHPRSIQRKKTLATCANFAAAAKDGFAIFLRTAQRENYLYRCKSYAQILGQPMTNRELINRMSKLTRLTLREEDFPLPPHADPQDSTIELLLNASKVQNLVRLSIQTSSFMARGYQEVSDVVISHETMKSIATRCPNLRTFHLECPERLTKEASMELCRLKHLKTVGLGGCEKVDDATLDGLAQIPTITNVNLYACRSVTDVGITNLLQSLPKLHRLSVGYSCGEGPDLGLDAPYEGWLERYELSEARKARITEAIANHGKRLTHLNLAFGSYRDTCIIAIVTNCPNLTHINTEEMMHRTPQETLQLTAKIKELKPDLKVFPD